MPIPVLVEQAARPQRLREAHVIDDRRGGAESHSEKDERPAPGIADVRKRAPRSARELRANQHNRERKSDSDFATEESGD